MIRSNLILKRLHEAFGPVDYRTKINLYQTEIGMNQHNKKLDFCFQVKTINPLGLVVRMDETNESNNISDSV